MSKYFDVVDRFAIGLAKSVIRYRFIVVIVCVAAALAIGTGGKLLSFSTDYRVFFSGDNPELTAFENFQKTYVKNDNFFFVLEPKNGNVFTNENLKAVEILTEKAWLIPFTNRVDSISNFQNSYADDDDLTVEDLYTNAENLSAQEINRVKGTSINEPLLLDQLIKADGSATAINVVMQFPGQSLYEVPTAAAKAREYKALIEQEFPDIKVSLTGFSMLNNAFAEAGYMDSIQLVPLMYGVLVLLTLLALRSIVGTLMTIVVVYLSIGVGMGLGGFTGVLLTPISNSAPIIILTLAIADSIHILLSFKKAIRQGMSRHEAVVESLRINLMPVTVTSLTTIVGFLALNFSDAPPYWHLGNMASAGIAAGWLLSITLLPALMAIVPMRIKQTGSDSFGEKWMDKLAGFVNANTKMLASSCIILSLVLVAFIPSIEFDDQWSDYFSKKIEFRNDTDQATTKFGMYPIEYSVPAAGPGDISSNEYLTKLEAFTDFLRQQPNVVHVFSITDIVKRLNKNVHGDNQSFYEIPGDDTEAAQYLLLYELSLPYGLDLNDRINIDKSATRVTVTLGKTSTTQTKAFIDNTQAWIDANFPAYMQETKPTSAQVMFTYIADRNVQSMIAGTIMAILAIALILIITLRSFKLGLLSLVPNGLPILAAFGIWSLLVGTVGFSVAAVAAISLGIVVDDTVHFLAKYDLARREKMLDARSAVAYAFHNVGPAIVINTLILVAGFIVMAGSTFKINADLGLLTTITILLALLLDFLLLPALLVLLNDRKHVETSEVNMIKNQSMATEGTLGAIVIAVSALLLTTSDNVVAKTTDNDTKGYEISARSDRTDRGFTSSEVELKMVLKNASGEEASRNLHIKTLEVANEDLGDKSIVIFNEPKDISGTALLSHARILEADDQWLYLPSLKRIKRISSKNKSGPFVGSEFAFEDFTSLELNKYSHEWLREEACEDMTCDLVKRLPQYEFSGYSHLLVWIDQKAYQVRKVEFYDRKGDLLKTLTLSDYQLSSGYWRAHTLDMVNHQTNKSTTLLYGDYVFNTGLTEQDFDKGRLKRIQ
ncbi:outer membrane lipoprotein-sorting protein [Cellvibrio sp. ARAG 10.3]|uniref:outer membrane lipoprotein-sorting protein n=1 Tax=Cellvibrio sp. ARAG 10.3 TaxID=3451358 RepID=UPI003F448072